MSPLSSLSDASDAEDPASEENDSDVLIVPVKRTKIKLKVKREEPVGDTAVSSGSMPRRGLKLKLATTVVGGQSAAVTRVKKKRKLPDTDLTGDPPLKRARQRVKKETQVSTSSTKRRKRSAAASKATWPKKLDATCKDMDDFYKKVRFLRS